MKNFRIFILSLFLQAHLVSAQDEVPYFNSCANQGPECHEAKYKALKDSIVQKAFAQTGYFFNDSLYLSFHIGSDHSIKIKDQFYLNIGAGAAIAKQYIIHLEDLVNAQNADQDFDLGIIFRLPESFDTYQEIEEVKYPLKTNLCPGFNEKGDIGCSRYLTTMTGFKLMDLQKVIGVTEARLYFHEGKLSAIRFEKFSQEKFYNGLIYQTFNEVSDTVLKGSLSKTSDQYIDFSLRYFGDSKAMDYYQSNLDYLATLANKEPFLEELFSISNGYNEKEERNEYILQQLKKIGYDKKEAFRYNGWVYRLDSLRSYDFDRKKSKKDTEQFNEVHKVPVFQGCDADDNNKKLQHCFQKSMQEFVAQTYAFPERARQAGIQGRVYVDFVIEKDGTFNQIRVVKGVHPLLDLESIRVISLIPNATQPAMKEGEAVRIRFTMPFNLKLQ